MKRLYRSIFALAVVTGGCGITSPRSGPELVSISPAASATNVAPSAQIQLTFSEPMMAGTETRISLHEGTATGPGVAVTYAWSDDGRMLTVMPSAPMGAGTAYAIRMDAGMTGRSGAVMTHKQCAQLGGHEMMDGGTMMGSSMMGTGMMGSGTSGMSFTFVTR